MEGLYILLTAFALIALGLVALYILHAIALYRLAVNAGIPSPVLAWVPIARNYILGCLCDRAAFYRTGKRRHFAFWMPVMGTLGSPFLYYLLAEVTYSSALGMMNWMTVTGLQSLLGFFSWALTTWGLYNLYCDYAPGKQDLYTVLGIPFAAIAPAVCLYLIRWNIPLSVREAARPRPAYPPPPPPPTSFGNENKQKKF